MLRPSNRAVKLDGPKCIRARARKGLSRERLAEDSRGGLSVATIKRLENGIPVYFDTARRYAALLEVTPADLASESGAALAAPNAPEDASHPKTVAVLPFECLGTMADSQSFADGLVEDLITRLGRHWFPVISRSSTFRYRGTAPDPQRLRVELGADYVVEGSVRREASTIRVTVRLTDTKSNKQLWGEIYDRDYKDIFALQTSLVSMLLNQINNAILELEVKSRLWCDAAHLAAWELALRGSWYFHRRTKQTNAEARSLFEQALRRERALPMAWYGLAMTHQRAIVHQWSVDLGRSLHQLRDVCAGYMREHPSDAGVHVATAYALVYSGDRASAVSRLRDAIELDPNMTTAYCLYGQTLAMENKPDEAIEQFELALRLSPRDAERWLVQTGIALCHFVAERYEEMSSVARYAVELQPDMPFPYGTLAVALTYLGDTDGARSAVRSMLTLEPKTSLHGLSAIVAAINPDIVARYASGLRRSGVPG